MWSRLSEYAWAGGSATVLALAMVLMSSPPAVAELVLLVGGGVLKVDDFHREGDRIKLLLPSGGTLSLSLLRIDRILADELEREDGIELLGAGVDIAFSPDHLVPETPYGELIFLAAERHAINPQLIAAMVRTESAFDPRAVSVKGASGLLQLMPATARRFGVAADQIFDPEANLDAGVRYIRWLSERFEGNLALVLAGYNAGEATVERYSGVPPYAETREYLRRIYSLMGVDLPTVASE